MTTKLVFKSVLFVLLFSSCRNTYHILFGGPSTKVHPVAFNETDKMDKIRFQFPDTAGNIYMRRLRTENRLLDLIQSKVDDKDKALALLNWTHQQWEHNGGNEPSHSDALTILKEARAGKKFRCVEYGIVSTSALFSVGMKARVLGIKTKDVETAKTSAGHVLAEVWLSDIKKWALIDGQFNAMPTLEGVPLNAVEFQKAITDKKPFKLINSGGELSAKATRDYLKFVRVYLYYFNTSFDVNYGNSNDPDAIRYKIENKSSLMLVPMGAKNPVVFQRKWPMDYLIYTNNVKDFYDEPK
jgi:Transglutaminase-like superfamily